MVQSNVQKAFNLIGDLAETIILSSTSSSNFDYNIGEAVVSPPLLYNIKAIVNYSKKKDSDTIVVELLVMTKDIETISDLDAFDKVTVRGIEYRVITPSINNGYIVTISATKETI
jgi:hypothetical protein